MTDYSEIADSTAADVGFEGRLDAAMERVGQVVVVVVVAVDTVEHTFAVDNTVAAAVDPYPVAFRVMKIKF